MERTQSQVLINASNLHVGGGVAVATSFIDELSQMSSVQFDVHVMVSALVNKNLMSLNVNTDVFESYTVVDSYGISAIWRGIDKKFLGMDLVFTIFGPAYFLFNKNKHIFGFAQPNIIYPNNPIIRELSLYEKLKTKVKYKVQEFFFSRSDSIIVELEHVKERLLNKYLFRHSKIYIVWSAVNSVYSQREKWKPLKLPRHKSQLSLGIISRNYPHKNLKIFPEIKKIMKKEYNIEVSFFVTFDSNEWHKCSNVFKENVINVGSLSLDQCPSFYSQMDAIIFPSLLECFSAVPIEAMMSKVPLFASDLPFIRDCCAEYCNYFNPLDSSNAAKVIKNFFSLSKSKRNDFVKSSYKYVQNFPDAAKRAEKYVNIINGELE